MSDSNFLHRVLLVDFDGADAATAATDNSYYEHALTFNGGAALTTAEKAYGTAGLILDGVDSYVSVEVADFYNADIFEFYRDVHCIEFEYAEAADPGDFTFIAKWEEGTNDRCWRIKWDSTNNRIHYEFSNNGFGAADNAYFDFDTDAAGALDLFDGAFHHIAIYRVTTGEIYVAVDGEVGALDTGAAVEFIDHQPLVPITIGCDLSSGVAQNFATGTFDALRMTRGIQVYTATTGSFTEPSAAHDTVDALEGAAYSYPLTVNLPNPTVEFASDFPWLLRQASTERGFGPVRAAGGGPTPHVGSYCFAYGSCNFNMSPNNCTYSINEHEIDLTRYDSQFLDDIDDGLLEFTASNYIYIENAGDGWSQLVLEFYDEAGALIGRRSGDFFIPVSTVTWEQDSVTARIPKLTRKVKIVACGSKYTGVFADVRLFHDSFAASITQITGYATDPQHDTYFSDVDDMVANWVSANTTLVKQDSSASTTLWMEEVCYDNTAVGTDVECHSPIFALASDTTDIDAGSVDYEISCMMANNVDTAALWVEFYEADGVTIVGTRASTTQVTRDGKGEDVTLTGTIPTGAEKAWVGFTTGNGASGADFHGRDVSFFEVGPAIATGGGGGDAGTIAITTNIIVG